MIIAKNPMNKYKIVLVAMLIIASLIFLPGTGTQLKQLESAQVAGEIIVVFNDEVDENELNSLTYEYGDAFKVIRHIGDYALLAVYEEEDFVSVLNSLKDDPQVAEAQENTTISSLNFSNDTYAASQWAIDNPGYYINLSNAGSREKAAVKGIDMDVVEAWDAFKTSKQQEVVVAIVDTGVDYKHPDLVDHMWVNDDEIEGDKIDNDNNGYIDDIYGWDFYNKDASVCHYGEEQANGVSKALKEDNDDHGTHIAGIIGAVSNNNIGIAGVASNINIKIMALKINGGHRGSGNISDAIEAIKYATMMGADICNMSWGTSQYTSALKQIMKESDMLFVAAAGNTGDNNDEKPIYPASLKLDNLISVTFINSAGELSYLSNYGADSVDIAAPGDDIFSTVVGGYVSMSGSSMAAPQVAAVAAILYAKNDHLYPANVKEILLNNLKPISNLEGHIRYAGIPSAYQSLMSANNLIQDVNPPKLSFDTIYSKSKMRIPINSEDTGSSSIRVVKWYIGEKTLKDFGRGMKGTTVEDNQISISKEGVYTFYSSDYAGNETVQTYEVVGDTNAPIISSTVYTVSNSYKSRTVTVRVADKQSGLKRVKYMSGIKKPEDFLPADAGNVIEVKDGKGTFKVKEDGTYTIFASDNRGNMITRIMVIKTVKAIEIKFIRNQKTMVIGEQYTLRTLVKPLSSTDRITYVSSNEKVASVSSTGEIKALAKGKSYITARASSGLVTSCELTVKLK